MLAQFRRGVSRTVSSAHQALPKKRLQEDLMRNYLQRATPTLAGLDSLKRSVFDVEGKTWVSPVNFDSAFLSICTENRLYFDTGRSYVERVLSDGPEKLGIGTIGAVLRFLWENRDRVGDKEKKLVLELSDLLSARYDGVLDRKTRIALSEALCLTHKWTEVVEWISDQQIWAEPAPGSVWSACVEAAFRSGCPEKAQILMDQCARAGSHITLSLYEFLLRTETGFDLTMSWLNKHGIILLPEVADLFHKSCQENLGRTSVFTTITNSGKCNACGRVMGRVDVTVEDLHQLSNVFLKQALIGRDVHLKSKPKELDQYLEFNKKLGKVDVVIDGLNVAYAATSTSPSVSAKLLAAVVCHFVPKKVVVFARKHILNWPKKEIAFIKKHSELFLTENVSSDDPYLLHTAMTSGIGTQVVSRDLMRGHMFLLPTPQLQRVFVNWLQLHRLHLQHVDINSGQVFFKEPLKYLEAAQVGSDSCHVPSQPRVQGIPGHLKREGAPWLCISRVQGIH